MRIGTIYGGPDDSYFRQQFTDIFEYTHPNIKVEIVPAVDYSQYRYVDPEKQSQDPIDYVESTKKLLTGDNPVDVIVGDTNIVKSLIQENLLKQLDPLMQEDKFDTSDFVPTVIDGIKDLGDGSGLYALSPTFSSSALFYNKKIFQDAGVDLPKDGMTWDEAFDLARLVAKGEGKDRVYGISFNRYQGGDPYYDAMTYSAPLQLRTFDEKAEKMTVNTPQWEKVWSTISKLVKDKIVPTNDQQSNGKVEAAASYNPIQGDLFLSSKVAMTIGDSNYVTELNDANKNAEKIKDFHKVDWDIVTIPTHPEKPGIGGNIYLSNLMAINSNAQNPEDAWEFIKFLNSEEWAKIKSRSSSYEMVARKSYIQPREGLTYNIQAFYTLKPVPPANTRDDQLYQKMPNLWLVSDQGRTFFQEVIDNKKTPAEALQAWEKKGNEMLLEMKNNPTGKPAEVKPAN
nr:extracellular solute-binding protein [Paenibacillus sediminis]